MTLSDSLRKELKTPLGALVPESGADRETVKAATAGKYVISVGDRTTEKMIGFGLVPSLQIIDNQEKRQRRRAPDGAAPVCLECKNPASEITKHSIDVIKKALSLEPPVRIIVDGEEDLLVIPACIYAPENSAVLYGQPDEGLVIVDVTPEIRNKTQSLLYLINGV